MFDDILYFSPFNVDKHVAPLTDTLHPGATSDHLTLVRAYAGWIRAKARGRGFERDFLAKTFLSAQTLRWGGLS
jgi:hypothetical protein